MIYQKLLAICHLGLTLKKFIEEDFDKRKEDNEIEEIIRDITFLRIKNIRKKIKRSI